MGCRGLRKKHERNGEQTFDPFDLGESARVDHLKIYSVAYELISTMCLPQ